MTTDHGLGKIKTKKDLVRLIESLPDDWIPVGATISTSSEVVAMATDGDLYEGHKQVEIVIRGPLQKWVQP
jgi:hypothetical protein